MRHILQPSIYLRLGLAATGLALFQCGQAEIDYSVSISQAGANEVLHIEMLIPSRDGKLELQMPNWMPGAYFLGDFGKNLTHFTATDGANHPVTPTQPNFYTWDLKGKKGAWKVSYDMPITVENDIAHYNGAASYLYVVGRKNEHCQLHIAVDNGWKVAAGLDPIAGYTNEFFAPTYDVLADSPITLGKFIEDDYTSHGVLHKVVIYGPAMRTIDQRKLEKIASFVSDAEITFWNGSPNKRYVWHFSAYDGKDGGGGLEHLNGTEISVATGLGAGAMHVLAHEYFHQWNVKRIRSFVLGPFDYTKLPKTGALWWLEGVTDYYSILLPTRYGWYSPTYFQNTIAQNYSGVESNPAHTLISAYDSSARVGDAAGGRGNSQGYNISYYQLGWLLGLMMDIEIRDHSHGKYSLDNVLTALWNECKNNKPGFQEGEIRRLAMQYGGPTLGTFYDHYVIGSDEYPLADELKKIGLNLVVTKGVSYGLPFKTRYNPTAHRLEISDPETSGFQAGDILAGLDGIELVSKDGTPLSMSNYRSAMAKVDSAQPILASVLRNGQIVTKTLAPSESPILNAKVLDADNTTSAQLAMRKALLAPRKGTEPMLKTPVIQE